LRSRNWQAGLLKEKIREVANEDDNLNENFDPQEEHQEHQRKRVRTKSEDKQKFQNEHPHKAIAFPRLTVYEDLINLIIGQDNCL
jgi:hypothetical protein